MVSVSQPESPQPLPVQVQAQAGEEEDDESTAPFAFEEPSAVAGGGKQPRGAFPASAAGAPVLRGDSSGSSSSASAASSSGSLTAEGAVSVDDDDDVWAWADSLLDGASGAALGALDGSGGDCCDLVTEPEAWMLLERPPLFDSMGLL